ncbi:hypothetical protein B0T25DRAFT_305259 [Lasiosphaeria hispida]|uniref:Uncharacterized protein n=1 Tax=Lasiosphaeria hispida TaxID=260671 RepID=A0AAJ0H972_9PEZI|nr:hypothetical protein B0T25DRAFT_305259 [Lasiosphaeria hispida]
MMSPALDPQEIWRFLDTGYGESPNASRDYDPSAPRVPPSFDQTSTVEAHSVDWGQEPSNYTTTPTSVSRGYGSVFSQKIGGSGSSVGGSTAPSDHPRPRFEQQFTYPPPGTDSSFELWCEFRDLLGCGETFRGNDKASWIQHHAEHLHDKIPAQLMCWFCDDHGFLAERTADRPYNFEQRMEHIHQHMSDDYPYPTLDTMRPDFYMIKHLHKHRLINDGTYNSIIAFTEVPPEYQLPDSDPRPLGQAKQREQGQCHDLQYEDRRRRRQREDTKQKDGRKKGRHP